MLEKKHHYEKLSKAVNYLKNLGYTLDFSFIENCLICDRIKLSTDDYEISDLYCYYNEEDPEDYASVFAIKTKEGLKGIIVTGYGLFSNFFEDICKNKLAIH